MKQRAPVEVPRERKYDCFHCDYDAMFDGIVAAVSVAMVRGSMDAHVGTAMVVFCSLLREDSLTAVVGVGFVAPAWRTAASSRYKLWRMPLYNYRS